LVYFIELTFKYSVYIIYICVISDKKLNRQYLLNTQIKNVSALILLKQIGCLI